MTEKQGCGDEGETREAREGKQGETRRWVSVRRREDPGKIHRSKEFGVQGCRRKFEEGRCWCRERSVRIRVRGGLAGARDEGETRTIGYGGVLGNQVRSVSGRWMSSGERRG